MIFIDVFKAMSVGKELKNKETYKNLQVLTNILSVLVLFGVNLAKFLGYDVPITEELINQLSVSLAGVVFVGNAIITLATSKTVGLPNETKRTTSDQDN